MMLSIVNVTKNVVLVNIKITILMMFFLIINSVISICMYSLSVYFCLSINIAFLAEAVFNTQVLVIRPVSPLPYNLGSPYLVHTLLMEGICAHVTLIWFQFLGILIQLFSIFAGHRRDMYLYLHLLYWFPKRAIFDKM